jgi:hypothetical protein
MTYEEIRMTKRRTQNDMPLVVILSEAKDLFQGEGEILRCAQNDVRRA